MKGMFRNNKGSTLVSVLIVIGFISILATTLLYLSLINFRMKEDDKAIKVSFYDTEEVVDVVRANIIKMASDVDEELYPEMMVSMGARSGSGDVQYEYGRLFMTVLQKKIEDYFAGTNLPVGIDLSGESVVKDDTEGKLTVKGIKAKRTNANGYTSIISTDIVVEVPKRIWPYDDAAKTVVAGSSSSEDVDYFKCVYYNNWVKE